MNAPEPRELLDYKGFLYEYYPEYSAVVINEYNHGNDIARVLRASIYRTYRPSLP